MSNSSRPTSSESPSSRSEKASDYLDPYREAVQRFGPTFESTLWNSRRSQVARFDVLLSMVDLNGRRVLDAGCGLGDLCEHMAERGVAYAHYIGIDGLPSVIDKAKIRPLANAEFHAVDFVADPDTLSIGEPDVVFFSGSLNTIDQDVSRQLVRHAFEHASIGVVFNFLSDRCGPSMASVDTGPAKRFRTFDWLDWAVRLTPHVAFRQDYLRDGHDATIGMWHALQS